MFYQLHCLKQVSTYIRFITCRWQFCHTLSLCLYCSQCLNRVFLCGRNVKLFCNQNHPLLTTIFFIADAMSLVFRAIKIQVAVFWVVTSCNFVLRYQRFGGNWCLHLQNEVKMEAAWTSETLVS